MASFVRSYPAEGPIGRKFVEAVQLQDGGYIVVDHLLYDGPGLNGLGIDRLTSAGLYSWSAPVVLLSPWPDISNINVRGIEVVDGDLYVLSSNHELAKVSLTSPSEESLTSSLTQAVVRATAVVDGTVMAIGYKDDDNGTRLWFATVDSKGQLVDAVEPTAGAGVKGQLARALGSEVLVVGTINGGATGDDLWLGRINRSGVHQWVKSYPEPLVQEPIAVLPDVNGITVVSKTPSGVDGSDRVHLLRADHGGEKLWATVPEDVAFTAHDAIRRIDASGGYIVVGAVRGNFSQPMTVGRILVLDAAGDVEAETVMDHENGPHEFTSISAIETGYILTGVNGEHYAASSAWMSVTNSDLATPCEIVP